MVPISLTFKNRYFSSFLDVIIFIICKEMLVITDIIMIAIFIQRVITSNY
jgi:hypothetical protein